MHNPKIEVVDDYMGRFEINGASYEVSPATDFIMRFVDHEYDYLHYLDPEVQGITLHWLGQAALSTLVDFGISQSRLRLKMMGCEHEEWIQWKADHDLQEYDDFAEE